MIAVVRCTGALLTAAILASPAPQSAGSKPTSELASLASTLTAQWQKLSEEFDRQFGADGSFNKPPDNASPETACSGFSGRYQSVKTAFSKMQEARRDYFEAALAQTESDAAEIRSFAGRLPNSDLDTRGMLADARRDLAAYERQRRDLAAQSVAEEATDSLKKALETLQKLIDQTAARVDALDAIDTSGRQTAASREQALALLKSRADTFRKSLTEIPQLTRAYEIYFVARWSRYRLNCLIVEPVPPCVGLPGKKCP